MIPRAWLPHHRSSDGELVGYLDGTDPTVIPRTLFGYPLAEAGPADAAARLLESRGLACLGERWVLTRDDGEQVDVVITTAYADRVDLVETECGFHGPESPRHSLPAPTGDRLMLGRSAMPYRGIGDRG